MFILGILAFAVGTIFAIINFVGGLVYLFLVYGLLPTCFVVFVKALIDKYKEEVMTK